MENLVMFSGAYQGKVVWLSGHTGFKGAWLATWLLRLGARVHGFSLPAENPSLFNQLGLESRLDHEIGDVCNVEAVTESIARVQPDFVFHLAAQALVRRSYEEPLLTYATNTMGAAHVLDVLRLLNKQCAAVFVTTDKCYENRESGQAYTEEDHLGGFDPYSSSKAAAEIVIAAYRRSFFGGSPVRIASARAGNVIGGGDWALDRIVPDCIRHLERGEAIPVRNPSATRPWQHVLEPLSGYLWLGAELARTGDVATAFNFGPEKEANRPVLDLVRLVLKHWPGEWRDTSDPKAPHEAKLLMLSIEKAKRMIHWRPVWNFEKAVARTVDWYQGVQKTQASAENITPAQIDEYVRDAESIKLPWAKRN